MCTAIPVSLFLLLLLIAGTMFRFSRPSSPNASTLVSLMEDVLGGEEDESTSVECLIQPHPSNLSASS